ncbi:MAG: hypothetical protein K5905_19755 [Roseibium sp.]|uniref:hypothetical protein n=1 Tax=Roseibium sp. TaxID=1936156 RepID=UPI0026381818|nr:hypothetical protein [Roseibium sp.]MCV0427697.1 hypothetical protein [Roseibium sp.]
MLTLIHELGGVIKPKEAQARAIPQDDGCAWLVKPVTMPARPYLRPAAEKECPKMASRIRRTFNRRSKRPNSRSKPA